MITGLLTYRFNWHIIVLKSSSLFNHAKENELEIRNCSVEISIILNI